MPTTRLPSCIYHLRQDGIHEFTFTKASRQAIDEWVEHANGIYANVTEQDHLKFLIDLRESGVMPLPYLSQRGRAWVNSLKIHPQVNMAILHKGDVLLSLSNALIRNLRLGHLHVHWFHSDKYQAAITWLNTHRAPKAALKTGEFSVTKPTSDQ